MRGEIPVAPFRDAFLASGEAADVVAMRMGWTRSETQRRTRVKADGTVSEYVYTRVRGDGSRLKRRLGLRRHKAGHRGHYVNERCDYVTAVKLADALGLDPHEAGI